MMLLRVGPLLLAGGKLLARDRGFVVEHCETGREALEFLKIYDYDLALIDHQLSDMTGSDVIRRARTSGFATPAIIIAAQGAVTSPAKIRAFESGADDFLIEPVDPPELLARIRAVARRGLGHASIELRCGPVTMHLGRGRAFVANQEIKLSRREFAMLEALLLRPGVVLTRAAFLNHLYTGIEEPEPKIVDVMICRLRQKLASAGAPRFIETVWGRGFRTIDPSAA